MTAEQQQHQLSAALQLSKTGSGRQQLIESGEIRDLLALLAAHVPLREVSCEQNSNQSGAKLQQLLILLRVLRNACAAGAAAAELLQDNRVHEHAGQLAASLSQQHMTVVDQEQQKEQTALLLAALQLLSNMSVASADAACAVWEQLFPDIIQTILAVQQGDVHAVAALLALNCVRSSHEALRNLSSSKAGTIWLQLLAPVVAASMGTSSGSISNAEQQLQQPLGIPSTSDVFAPGMSKAGNDNLCLLVKAVALQFDCLHKIMQCLQTNAQDQHGRASAGSADGISSTSSSSCTPQSSSSSNHCAVSGIPGFQPNMAHAVLLHIVQLEIEAIPAAHCSEQADIGVCAAIQQQPDNTAMQDAPAWVQYLVRLLQEMSGQVSRHLQSQHTVAAHVLEATLQVLKAVVAREDAGRGLLQYAAAGAGAVPSPDSDCIVQLHALGLTQQLLTMLQQLGVPLKATQQEQRQQLQPQPYAGYRADLVAVLSNMVHEKPSIQHDVMAAGGIELLLNNCNLDDTAPLAREWALWSIRNMCKDNTAVQQYVAKFKAVDAIQSDELDRMGKELQLDKMTNKLRLVEKAKQGQQHQ